MHRFIRSAATAFLIFVASAGADAAGDPPGRVGRLSLVEGDVTFHDDAAREAAPATLNWPVTSGGAISTAPDARAEVRIGSTAIRLDWDGDRQSDRGLLTWHGNEDHEHFTLHVVLARGDFLDTDDLNLSNIATAGESAEVASPKTTFEPMSLDEIERRHIHATLRATGWNKSRAATILGIERSTLDRKIRRYELAGGRDDDEE